MGVIKIEYIYAGMLLHNAKQPISEENVKNVLSAAGVAVDEVRVKALVAALSEINIDEAIKAAAVPVAAAPAAAAPAQPRQKQRRKRRRKRRRKKLPRKKPQKDWAHSSDKPEQSPWAGSGRLHPYFPHFRFIPVPLLASL